MTQSPAAPGEAPPIPKGFESEQQAISAAQTGRLKIIDVGNVSVPESVKETTDIEYKNANGLSLKLDLYEPTALKVPAPAIVFIHGGAWRSGARQIMKFYSVHFATRGYVTATISYRLAGQAPFPAAVEDAMCAVQWLRANAETYSIDPERIAVSGNSAGGHLALMVGYASEDDRLTGDCGLVRFGSKPQAVINFYGPVDLTREDAIHNNSVNDFIGKSYEEAENVYRLASPLFHVSENSPPTLTFHGTIDNVVKVSHADQLDEKLTEAGVEHIYEKYDGWGHVMDIVADINQRCLYVMEEFLEKHLK